MDQDVEDEFASLAVDGLDNDTIGFGEDESEHVEGRIELCL